MIVYKQISQNIFKTWVFIALFMALIVSLGYFFGCYYNDQSILVFAFGFSLFSVFFSYWFSDKIVLGLAGAKEIAKKSEFPELYRIVENLAITAGLPMPKLYVVDDLSLNAFATGRDKNHAVVAVNRGLLEVLDKDEVEGVIAHELSHIGNRDILLSTIIVVLVGFVSILSDMFLRSRLWHGSRDRDDRRNGGVLMIIGVALVVLSPVIAFLIQMAISRKREFLADANAVLLTRHPDGLANALRKISLSRVKPHYASSAMSHLYISSPLKEESWFTTLFSTHPSIKKRIELLEKIDK